MTVYYVSTTGNDSNSGITPDRAFLTIQKACNVVGAGDTVLVAPGTYTQALASTASGTAVQRIQYVSTIPYGANIRSVGAASTWDQSGDYVDIIGFDISGDGNNGIRAGGSFQSVQNCRVHDVALNAACTGGAGILFTGYLTGKHDSVALGNLVFRIGPQFPFGNPSYCNQFHGIYYASMNGVCQNNICYLCNYGIQLWHAATNIILANNLLFNNYNGGMVLGGVAGEGNGICDNCTVSNNIAYNNGRTGIIESGVTGTNNRYLFNAVSGNPSGNWALQNGNTHSGDVNGNPLFQNYQADGSGDYHLTAKSPCIDAGSNIGAPLVDFDGQKRPSGSGWDIGPYEVKQISFHG